MKLFMNNQTGGWVDLYFNDVECLKKTIEQIRAVSRDESQV